MTVLRVGTRGSDLALWQTDWVCRRLLAVHPTIDIKRIVIKTDGDELADRSFGEGWPVGAFVNAIEKALLEDRVDFAVHSYKDLQTAETVGLTVAAVPEREVVHDLMLTRECIRLTDLPCGARIGTNSPRRAAQLLRLGSFEIIPIRGNVPTRIARIERDNLDGIVIAAAGFKRLGLDYPNVTELPLDGFLPAPAQGALAVQACIGSTAHELVASIDHDHTRRTVDAERSVLRAIAAGCHTPVGALATIDGSGVSLHARIFSDDYVRMAEGRAVGVDPQSIGASLGLRLKGELESEIVS